MADSEPESEHARAWIRRLQNPYAWLSVGEDEDEQQPDTPDPELSPQQEDSRYKKERQKVTKPKRGIPMTSAPKKYSLSITLGQPLTHPLP